MFSVRKLANYPATLQTFSCLSTSTAYPLKSQLNVSVMSLGKIELRYLFIFVWLCDTCPLSPCYRNRSLRVYLERFGVSCSKWLFRVICGYVDIQTLYAGDKKAKMVLISRISCERAGTR